MDFSFVINRILKLAVAHAKVVSFILHFYVTKRWTQRNDNHSHHGTSVIILIINVPLVKPIRLLFGWAKHITLPYSWWFLAISLRSNRTYFALYIRILHTLTDQVCDCNKRRRTAISKTKIEKKTWIFWNGKYLFLNARILNYFNRRIVGQTKHCKHESFCWRLCLEFWHFYAHTNIWNLR